MFTGNKYTVRRKIFAFLGQEVEVYDENEKVVLFAKQKAFKLREKLDIFTSSERSELVLSIQARNILDFQATYDVTDGSGTKIGAFRRKGLRSILRDEWEVLDVSDNVVGTMIEDNMTLALVRRFLLNLVPQDYSIIVDEKEVLDLKQPFNPFVYKLNLEFKDEKFDKRLGVVGGILLAIIEGRQE